MSAIVAWHKSSHVLMVSGLKRKNISEVQRSTSTQGQDARCPSEWRINALPISPVRMSKGSSYWSKILSVRRPIFACVKRSGESSRGCHRIPTLGPAREPLIFILTSILWSQLCSRGGQISLPSVSSDNFHLLCWRCRRLNNLNATSYTPKVLPQTMHHRGP